MRLSCEHLGNVIFMNLFLQGSNKYNLFQPPFLNNTKTYVGVTSNPNENFPLSLIHAFGDIGVFGVCLKGGVIIKNER